MFKEQLKEALGVIWAKVYRATQIPYLSQDETAKLQEALTFIREGSEGDYHFKSRASYIDDCVRTSGILSILSRKPRSTEGIMAECERLQRYLDADNSK